MKTRSSLHRGVGVAAALAALILAVTPTALAGKPSGGGSGTSGTISLVLLDSTDGLAHFGNHVTFQVSTTATTMPWVELKCYVSGTLVYDMSNGIFPTSLNQIFTLGPTPLWSSGAADCTAYLQNITSTTKKGGTTVLASMNFHVYA